MLETPPDEPIVQIQRVDHESRVHIDIETDDIPHRIAPCQIRFLAVCASTNFPEGEYSMRTSDGVRNSKRAVSAG
jgi:hypothetical protein